MTHTVLTTYRKVGVSKNNQLKFTCHTRSCWRFQYRQPNVRFHFGLNDSKYKSATLITNRIHHAVHFIRSKLQSNKTRHFYRHLASKRISTRTFTNVTYLLRSQMIQWPVQSADTITLYSVDIFRDVIAEWWPVSVASKPVHIKPFVYKTIYIM